MPWFGGRLCALVLYNVYCKLVCGPWIYFSSLGPSFLPIFLRFPPIFLGSLPFFLRILSVLSYISSLTFVFYSLTFFPILFFLSSGGGGGILSWGGGCFGAVERVLQTCGVWPLLGFKCRSGVGGVVMGGGGGGGGGCVFVGELLSTLTANQDRFLLAADYLSTG